MPNKQDKSMMNSPYYAGYSRGKAATQYPYPKAGVRAYPPSASNPYKSNKLQQNATQKVPQAVPLTPREQRQLKRARRRNRNYFFVMRRGVSFGMFICFFLYIAVIAVSFLNISPINGFVSLFTIPDDTTYMARWAYEEEVDEDGYSLIYEDKSEFVSVGDPIMGFVDSLKGLLGLEEEVALAEEEPSEEEAQEPIEEELPAKQYYNDFLRIMEDRQSDYDVSPKIAYLLFKYFPAALALAVLTALIAVFTSFGAARGRRIYKGFAIAAIVMLLAGVATLAAGYALSNVLYGNAMGPFDFGNIQNFLLRGVMGPPYSSIEALAYPSLKLVSGFLIWLLLILPMVILILSIFCRKKVSYRIFDK